MAAAGLAGEALADRFSRTAVALELPDTWELGSRG
jgi:hypothetical protein